MRVTIAGLGYVGLSNALLLARQHEVTGIDLQKARVDQVNARQSPLQDPEMIEAFAQWPLRLCATLDPDRAYRTADVVLIATPTNYDPQSGAFDTSSVEAVIAQARQFAPEALLVIKSTVPVGFTARMRAETGYEEIVFSPEFLREGRALHDNLHPSRIVVGAQSAKAEAFAQMLRAASLHPETPILCTGSNEAEAIKLFSNTYLAMRVAYFNELDSYALHHGLDARAIIDGLGHDPRIGPHYNNPSFGYGGYCLPKDSKQLRSHFEGLPQKLITATVEANATRMDVLAEAVLAKGAQTIGIWRLAMKQGSDNFRQSSILGLMERLARADVTLLLYEPLLEGPAPFGARHCADQETFFAEAEIILANRSAPELAPVAHKLFTRDLYHSN